MLISLKHPDNTLGIIKCSGTNPDAPCPVRHVHMPQADPLKTLMLSPQRKGDIPRTHFPNSGSGQQHCTALLSALCWVFRPTDINRGHSIGNQSKTHFLIPALSFGPTQRCYITVTVVQMIGYTPISSYRPLSAPIRLSGPWCLVLQSSWGGNTLSMAAQANKCHKNQSLID